MKTTLEKLISRLNRGAFNKEPATGSILRAEMQTYANEIDAELAQLTAAILEMQMHLADGVWLDKWCGTFGYSRLRWDGGAETDSDYLTRVVQSVLQPTQNNKALELMVLALYNVVIYVKDAEPHVAEFPEVDRPNVIGRFYIEFADALGFAGKTAEETRAIIAAIKAYVDGAFKAAGTGLIEKITLAGIEAGATDETIVITESVATANGYTHAENIPTMRIIYVDGTLNVATPGLLLHSYPHAANVTGSWRVNCPGLVVGNNDLWKEQVAVILTYQDAEEVTLNA